MAYTFFREAPRVPAAEIDELRAPELWPSITADAKASLEDPRAAQRFDFVPGRFRTLEMTVLRETGSESLNDLWVTNALENILPNVAKEELPGQAQESRSSRCRGRRNHRA